MKIVNLIAALTLAAFAATSAYAQGDKKEEEKDKAATTSPDKDKSKAASTAKDKDKAGAGATTKPEEKKESK